MTTMTKFQDDKALVTALVVRAQSGDRAAFGELFERFQGHVFAIALRRLGDFNEAQELCQDVFVQAMLKVGQLREPNCFAGWLRSITHRMAINRMVRRPHDLPTEQEALEAACVAKGMDPLAFVIAHENEDLLRESLDRLRDLDRETLVAFYVKGQSLLEMSDEFDAPLGTIKRRLHVARKRLAKEMDVLVAV
ncbi:MAG: sigma-70 family RNA polymerase sigma factor [Pirellulaceae bacterium]|jgi:RNA polymerase sigma-70 factor (ECF subfamily)|nr:sigma-70 family RNA polymerase sigma factor [Planctomycetaceae bacterium]